MYLTLCKQFNTNRHLIKHWPPLKTNGQTRIGLILSLSHCPSFFVSKDKPLHLSPHSSLNYLKFILGIRSKTNYLYMHSQILVKWHFLRSWTVSPRLEVNKPSKCSSHNFPHTTYISPFVENCQNYIGMYRCSPIVGRRSEK